jgi:hypothetical protein
MFLTTPKPVTPTYGYICRLSLTIPRRIYATVVDMDGHKDGDHWAWRSVGSHGDIERGTSAVSLSRVVAVAIATRLAADPQAFTRHLRANPMRRDGGTGHTSTDKSYT